MSPRFVFKTKLEKWMAFRHLYIICPGKKRLPKDRLRMALQKYYEATGEEDNGFIEQIENEDMSYWGIRIRMDEIVAKLESECAPQSTE